MYDIIADIHGQAEELEALLQKMGYKRTDGVFTHSERKAVFLGDFIDRGTQEQRTIEICRSMVASGAALAVMGNHEFNAICYATPDPSKEGEYLRSHAKPGNQKAHQAFLDEFPLGSPQHREVIEWFKTLPVFLDLGDIRLVHACWHQESLELAKPWLDDRNCLLPEAYALASNKTHSLYTAIEYLLKGVEIDLPDGTSFKDKDGKERIATRIRWWDKKAKTLADVAIGPGLGSLPEVPVETGRFHYHDSVPVFIGHYWLSGLPQKLTDYVACVDYSVAKKGGRLAAYRWQGETVLDNRHFVWVDRDQ
ncbi:metallophosphoesterase [Endozoicomonas sp. ALB032]|uniref:metallophosphoesterase n=1 Tax=Endozoicomonas sp. ALB032 TaxID=3403082 RepID=UPI003BB62FB0